MLNLRVAPARLRLASNGKTLPAGSTFPSTVGAGARWRLGPWSSTRRSAGAPWCAASPRPVDPAVVDRPPAALRAPTAGNTGAPPGGAGGPGGDGPLLGRHHRRRVARGDTRWSEGLSRAPVVLLASPRPRPTSPATASPTRPARASARHATRGRALLDGDAAFGVMPSSSARSTPGSAPASWAPSGARPSSPPARRPRRLALFGAVLGPPRRPRPRSPSLDRPRPAASGSTGATGEHSPVFTALPEHGPTSLHLASHPAAETARIATSARPNYRRDRESSWLLGLCSYLPLAALGYWPVWQHWSSQMNGCNCWDQVQQEWFVQWGSVGRGARPLGVGDEPHLRTRRGQLDVEHVESSPWGSWPPPSPRPSEWCTPSTLLLTVSLALLRQHHVPAPPPPLDHAGSRRPGWVASCTAFLPSRWQKGHRGASPTCSPWLPPLIVLVIDKLIKQEWPPLVGGSVIGAPRGVPALRLRGDPVDHLLLPGLDIDRPRGRLPAPMLRNAARTSSGSVGAAVGHLCGALPPTRCSSNSSEPIASPGPPQSHAESALFSSDRSEPHHPGGDAVGGLRLDGSYLRTRSLPRRAGEVTCYVGIPLLLLLVGTVVLLRKRILVRIFACRCSC